MTDVLTLFAVLFGVYLLQCIAWASRGDIAFRVDGSLVGKPVRRFLTITPTEYRLFLLHPLSPLSGAIVCEPFPLLQSSTGGSSECPDFEERSGNVAENAVVVTAGSKDAFQVVGRDILAGGTLIYKTHCHAFANILVRVLERLRGTPPGQWDRIIADEYEKMFDVSGAMSRLSEYKAHSGFLRTISVLVFVFVFCMAPLEIRLLGLGRSWPFLIASLVVCLGFTSWAFLRAHKTIYPGERDGRWQHAVTFALSPLSAMRANDVLLRDLFCAFHPLAVARVLMSDGAFRVQAEKELRNARYREGYSPPPMQRALEVFLHRVGLNVDDLLKPPQRESPTSSAYCPLCLSQFVVNEGECPDCTGVALERYWSGA
jgi:hypothetical protein